MQQYSKSQYSYRYSSPLIHRRQLHHPAVTSCALTLVIAPPAVAEGDAALLHQGLETACLMAKRDKEVQLALAAEGGLTYVASFFRRSFPTVCSSHTATPKKGLKGPRSPCTDLVTLHVLPLHQGHVDARRAASERVPGAAHSASRRHCTAAARQSPPTRAAPLRHFTRAIALQPPLAYRRGHGRLRYARRSRAGRPCGHQPGKPSC